MALTVENFVNVGLARNPLNWVLVILMLLIFLAGLQLLAPAMEQFGSDVSNVNRVL